MEKELDIMNKTELEIKSILDDMYEELEVEYNEMDAINDAIDLIKQEIGYNEL